MSSSSAAVSAESVSVVVPESVGVCFECTAPASVYCDQCKIDLCQTHSDMVHGLKFLATHVPMKLAEKATHAAKAAAAKGAGAAGGRAMCPRHPDHSRCLFCLDCKQAICALDTCVDEEHASHTRVEVEQAVEMIRVEQTAMRTKLGAGNFTKIAKDIATLQQHDQRLTSSHLKSEREIDSLCEELMQAARDHCDDLRRDLKHKTAVGHASIDKLLSSAADAAAAAQLLDATLVAASRYDAEETVRESARIAQLSVDVQGRLDSYANAFARRLYAGTVSLVVDPQISIRELFADIGSISEHVERARPESAAKHKAAH